MGLVIAYIILVLTGVGLGVFVYFDHKSVKQKNYDIEAYNQQLEVTKELLEQNVKRVQQQLDELCNLTNEKGIIYSNLCESIEFKQNKINELTEQQEKLKEQLTIVDTEKARVSIIVEQLQIQEGQTAARIDRLNESIATAAKHQQETLNQSFTAYCEALDDSYKNKEKEYDDLLEILRIAFNNKQEEAIAAFEKTKEICQAKLAEEEAELAKIRATRIAAQEALLREEELRDNKAFFTVSVDKANEHDLKILKSITSQLTNARPVLMAIWETFYRKGANDLAARVLKTEKVTGIYKITHIDSGICYIGQARDVKERWREHIKCGLGIDVKTYNGLYADMLKYGIEEFAFELLEECPIAQLDEKEAYYIQLYDSYNYGYNGTRGNKK